MKLSNFAFFLINFVYYSEESSKKILYDRYKLIRFQIDDIDWLENLEERGLQLNQAKGQQGPLIDIWSRPSRNHNYVDVLIAPTYLGTFKQILKDRKIYDIVIIKENIQEEIDKQREQIRKRRKNRSKRDILNFDLQTYHHYDEIVDFLRKLSTTFPHLVDFIKLTRTFEGRDLTVIKIGKKNFHKPAIFIDAGMHAREWITPAVALYIITQLVSGYNNDQLITKMLDEFDWYIIPVVNPDGYEYAMTTDRLWRKTRSRNVTVNKWCIGADPNRNWGHRWGEKGASRSPCSNIYPGSSPFSEVEIAAIKDYMTWQISDLRVYISLHSYGQLILGPWGYTRDKPRNYPNQKMAAQFAIEAIKNLTGASYAYGTISELMYVVSGTSVDYMYQRGVPYVYGMELRPEETDASGFTLSPKYIEPTGKETLAALFAILEHSSLYYN